MWKEITWTNGAYSVSNDGLVKSNDRLGTDGRHLKGKILKPWIGNHGYQAVSLWVNGKKLNKLVHVLVARAFVKNEDVNLEVDHVDGNKLNNAAYNLEWVTRKENLRRADKLGLIVPSERQKETRREIANISRKMNSKAVSQYLPDGTFVKTYYALADVHRELGLDISAVSRAASGKQKTSYGYLWKWSKESVTTIPQGSSCTGEIPTAKDENRKV